MANIEQDKLLWVTFEDFRHQNWIVYRRASEFMIMLWYDNMQSFEKVIKKAVKTLTSLWIDIFDNIRKEDRNWQVDYKLTRYACYIVAMNGDPKMPWVASSQNYFAEQTRKFELLQEDTERLSIRVELADGNKSLNSTVYSRWIKDYSRFNQAWRLWLYWMQNYELAKKRKLDPKKLYDSMWRSELAANLFRVTQTEEKIKANNINWQFQLEKAHQEVWKEVRDMVQKNTWVSPESLPQSRPLPELKKWLKQAQKELSKKD